MRKQEESHIKWVGRLGHNYAINPTHSTETHNWKKLKTQSLSPEAKGPDSTWDLHLREKPPKYPILQTKRAHKRVAIWETALKESLQYSE